jgi:glycerophosphoryl diester phosphodiesterase
MAHYSESISSIEQNGYGAIVHQGYGHLCLEPSRHYRTSEPACLFGHALHQRGRVLGPGSFPVEGPPPISAIPKKGELRHNGQASAHLEQRVVHAHLVVIKNTKLHDLTGEFHGVLMGIVRRHCDQGQETGAHLGNPLRTDVDGGFADPLQYGTHGLGTSPSSMPGRNPRPWTGGRSGRDCILNPLGDGRGHDTLGPMTHPYFDAPTPLILGHRGAAGAVPENTLMAFDRGLKDGAHMIECDVHVSRDGVPVVIHDPDLDRTTDGRGAVGAIKFSELQTLDAGYHFVCPETGKADYRNQGIRVPSLHQAFTDFPQTSFNIEIKAADRDLVGSVLSLIADFERADRTLVVAGDNAIQAQIRQTIARTGIRPALGASLGDIVEIVKAAQDGQPHSSDCMAIQIPFFFGAERLVTPGLIDHCHAHGVQVHVWTINSPEHMTELLDLGVDGLVTDWPGLLAEVLAQRP